jgi:hypothetical protein
MSNPMITFPINTIVRDAAPNYSFVALITPFSYNGISSSGIIHLVLC